MIAECFAHVTELKVICLDRMDVLDGESRGQCIKWLIDLAKRKDLDSVFCMATLWKQPPALPEKIARTHDLGVPF